LHRHHHHQIVRINISILICNDFVPTADSLLHGLFGHGALNGAADVYSKYPFSVPSADAAAEEDQKQKKEMAFKKRLLGDGASGFTGN